MKSLQNHQAKILGLLLALAAAVSQYGPQLKAILTPQVFSLGAIVLGVLVSGLDFLKDNQGAPKS